MTTTTTHDTILSARDIVKSFGAVRVLRGLSMDIRPGEIVAVVGDNGAGKSTFIKCLTGIYGIDSGEMLLRGEPTRLTSPEQARASGIETVYQDLGLVEELPVWHNLYLNRELAWGFGPFSVLKRRLMARNAAAMLAELDVRIPSPNTEVAALSGGQRQAIAISRAVSWSPSIVIMDEPTAALGVRETAAVEELILSLKERGTSVLLVSHDMTQVLRVCDRVTVLRQGVAVSSRTTAELSAENLVALITGARTDKEIFG